MSARSAFLQQNVRRLAAKRHVPGALHNFIIPSSVIPARQLRHVTTEGLSDDSQILAKQRLNRPVSPHLGIYKPQITWYPSMFNRITGVALSGIFYAYGLAYLAAPALGWHVGSASIAAAFAAWPLALKFSTKLVLALPFTFHSLNGLRHLMWDFTLGLKNKQVNQTGWAVVGLSVATAVGLALI